MTFPWPNADAFQYPPHPDDEPPLCDEAERMVEWARRLLNEVKRHPSERAFDLAYRLLTENFFDRRGPTRHQHSITGERLRHVCTPHVFEAAYRELNSLRIAFLHHVKPPLHYSSESVELAGLLLAERQINPRSGPTWPG